MMRKYDIIAIFTLFLMLGAFAPVSGEVTHQEEPGKVTIDTDGLHIEITGNLNVAKYTFRHAEDQNSTKYQVQFNSMFEFTDENDNGKYDTGSDKKVSGTSLSLNSLDVYLEGVQEGDNGNSIDFDLILNGTDMFDTLTFRNHLTGGDTQELKFDVILEGYNFTSDADNAHLAIGFKLLYSGGDGDDDENTDNTQVSDTTSTGGDSSEAVGFGAQGIFESETTASAGSDDVNVGLSSSNQNIAYLAYSSFEGTLEHDPTIGVQAAAGDDGGELPFPSLMIFAALVGILPIYKRTKDR